MKPKNEQKTLEIFKVRLEQIINKTSGLWHAKQMNRARKITKKLKTYLGRVYRELTRKATANDEELGEKFAMAENLLNQSKDSKNKLYSIHAPEVECISKGKAHKRYELGCKVSMATTSKND